MRTHAGTILALEASSTSAKAALYDSATGELSVLTEPFQLNTPDPSCRGADEVVAQVLALGRRRLDGRAVDLVTLGSTWHGLTLQTPDGTSLTPVFGWSYPGALDIERQLRTDTEFVRWYYARTGCPVSGSYPALKLLMLAGQGLDLTSGVVMDEGSVLFHRLTGRCATTAPLASGTGLFSLRQAMWDHDVMISLGLGRLRLPQLIAPRHTAPLVSSAARALGLPTGTPVLAPGPDGALSQLGDDATMPGIMTASMGTSGALRLAMQAPALTKRRTTWCYRMPSGWLAGAATSGCGNEVEWARRTLLDGAPFETIEPQLRPGPRDVPTFLPFHFGERTPGWHSRRPAGIVGLTSRHDPIDLYQSVLQGVVFNLRQGFDELVALVGRPSCVRLSGGVLDSGFWTQLVADTLGINLEVSPQQHASLVGAVRLGLSAEGMDDAAPGLSEASAGVVQPNPDLADYYQERYAAYRAAYDHTVITD